MFIVLQVPSEISNVIGQNVKPRTHVFYISPPVETLSVITFTASNPISQSYLTHRSQLTTSSTWNMFSRLKNPYLAVSQSYHVLLVS